MKIKLLCQNVLASPREIRIEQFPIEMGRGTTVGVRIDDRFLSRRHCELAIVDGQLHVRDLQSRHGTLVNGKSISEVALAPGDRLQIGLSHFIVQFDGPAPAVQDSAEMGLLAN